jgi:hypothetical protein
MNKLPREISNHNPLIVSTGKNENLPHIQFKFDLNWLQNLDFFVLVEQICNKPCKAKTTLDKIK